MDRASREDHTTASSERQAPAIPELHELYSPEAEHAVIGAMLLDPPLFSSLAVNPEDFYLLSHAAILRAGRKLIAKGITPDMVTLPDELEKQRAGVRFSEIVGLQNDTPSAVHAESYAAVVRDWAKRRAVMGAMTSLASKISMDGRYDDELQTAYDAIGDAMLREGPVDFRTADQIAAYYGAVEWAWPGWIPESYLSMIVGPQGAGKSYLAARLVGSLSGSLPTWPDDKPCTRLPGKVLIVETEELRGAFVERLDRLGVPRDRYVFGPGNETHIPNLARETAAIERLAGQEAVTAILIDSLSGAHDRDEDRSGMRQVLQRLAAMASRLRVPIILVHHARKRGELESVKVTLDRVRGSSTITQFCRAVLTVYRIEDGDQTGPVRLELIKSTFAAPPEALGFTITDAGMQFVDAPREHKPFTQRDVAKDLLLTLLKYGPMPQADIEKEANGAGVSMDTVREAKRELGVLAIRDGKRSCWMWSLPAKVKSE